MIHELTIGHFDPSGISQRRRTVLKPLEMDVVARLLDELGGTDAEGHPTLGGGRVRFEDGYLIVPWLGARANRVAEEFAIRMQRETGCLIADLGHRCLIEPRELLGLKATTVGAHEAATE
jgi:hypothetical protein